MLINCPECGRQISTEAVTCPQCGYPLSTKKPTRRKLPSRMRLPNGFGQISEIRTQSLRKPFRAMISVGTGDNGRPICRLLKPESYFETYNDAYAALVEYHRKKAGLQSDMTLKELYEEWSPRHFASMARETSVKGLRNGWKYCEPLYNFKVQNIKAQNIRDLLESDMPVSFKRVVKSLLNMLLDFAVENEIVERNILHSMKVENINYDSKNHIDFTETEMKLLWQNISIPGVKMLLVQCYSGWRPQELCDLKLENINLEERSFTGGLKTEAGKNRTVPIHSKISMFVEEAYGMSRASGAKTLFSIGKDPVTYNLYYKYLRNIIKRLGLNPEHRLHDPRVHFVTKAKQYLVDDFAVKRMVGHKISDITEAVYTRRGFDWLKSEIEKIK